jgi:hypothetical protein
LKFFETPNHVMSALNSLSGPGLQWEKRIRGAIDIIY